MRCRYCLISNKIPKSCYCVQLLGSDRAKLGSMSSLVPLKSLHYLEVSLGKRHLEAQVYICVGEAARLAGWCQGSCLSASIVDCLSLNGFESEHGVTSDVSAYELVKPTHLESWPWHTMRWSM